MIEAGMEATGRKRGFLRTSSPQLFQLALPRQHGLLPPMTAAAQGKAGVKGGKASVEKCLRALL